MICAKLENLLTWSSNLIYVCLIHENYTCWWIRVKIFFLNRKFSVYRFLDQVLSPTKHNLLPSWCVKQKVLIIEHNWMKKFEPVGWPVGYLTGTHRLLLIYGLVHGWYKKGSIMKNVLSSQRSFTTHQFGKKSSGEFFDLWQKLLIHRGLGKNDLLKCYKS